VKQGVILGIQARSKFPHQEGIEPSYLIRSPVVPNLSITKDSFHHPSTIACS